MSTPFFTVALVYIVALMSPGPDLFSVSQTAVSRSRKEAMMGVLGITRGVMVWVGVALLDLHLIIEKMAWLHIIIMVGGELYLCWVGYQMLRDMLKKRDVAAPTSQVELTQSGRSFSEDLLTNLTNPETIVYFGSVFSSPVGDNVGMNACRRIFTLITVEMLAWFTVVASLFTLPKVRRGYQCLAKRTDDFVGVLFVGFDTHLTISR